MSTVATIPSGGSTGFLGNGRMFYVIGELCDGTYLSAADVRRFALPSRVAYDIGDDILLLGCVAASSEFNGYAKKRYRMPLRKWGLDLVQKLAFRAAGASLQQRGYDYSGDSTIKTGYDAAEKYMENVRDYKIDPDIVESEQAIFTPRACSDRLRGW